MLLPLSWLRDFVAFDVPAEDLADRLITSGFEVEAIHRSGAPNTGDNHGAFVIGRVEQFVKHPNADRLRLCQVDTGDSEPRQIVCGASNFVEGDTVVVALPGALLPGEDAPLKQAKLRGEVSNGMMLSERELGLSDDHEGIIVLPGTGEFPVGSLLADHIALDDAVLDVSVESNRGDCLSVYGMAREVAVLFGLDLGPVPGVEPPVGFGATSDLVTVAIDAPDRCSRFTARGFSDVTVRPSPFRVRQRLASAGIRPISNVVDVTNYVMLELGNPLHVYDADRIPGQTLVARMAHEGEAITTLDGKDRVLTADVLVIADADGPSGIAGVMGSAASEIHDETKNVVLESACFERSGIQRTTKALGLRTEGSNRWEKGVNPELAPVAARRASELMVAWAGATALGGPQDVVACLPDPQTVTLRRSRPTEVLGLEVPDADVERILAGLGYAPKPYGDGWSCTVPFWRWVDATREIDLVEEIGRVHGLGRVPAVLPRIETGRHGLTREQRIRRTIEDHLAGAGLREAVTLSLADPSERERLGFGGTDPIVLRNPLSADLSELRLSLLPGLLAVVERNQTLGAPNVALYEVGGVYRPGGADGLAVESEKLGVVLAGRLGGDSWLGEGSPSDFSTMVAVIDGLMARLGVTTERDAYSDAALLHPGRAARVLVGGVEIGVLGEIHPALTGDLGTDGAVALAELDLTMLIAAVPEGAEYREVSSFPVVRQDIAVTVASDVTAGSLVDVAREAGGSLLTDVSVFDVFVDADRLGRDRVSVGLRLVFQKPDRTLTEEEASAVRDRIVDALRTGHSAELRG